jgi:rod shape-determining protein MreC
LSLRDGPLGDIKVPLTWSAAAALVIAVIIAAALLLTRSHDPVKAGAYDAARHAVDAVESPVGSALSAPVRWTGDGVDYVRGYFFAVSENRELKAKLAQAHATQDQLEAMQVENARLRAVLGIATNPPLPHIAAETISDSHGPFANTRLANAGADQGVTEGNPVISEHGLVGRIVGVSKRVSRVLLLTDAESRTPVLLVRTNGRAILSGDGGESPKLDYLRSALGIKEGDRVLTSGDGGVFPRGLPVGTVVHGLDGGWHVALDSDAAPIDFVQILLFTDFSQLAQAQALAPKELPTAMTEEPNPSIAPPTTSAPAPSKIAPAKTVPAKVAAPKAGLLKPDAAKPDAVKAAKAKLATASAAKPASATPATAKPHKAKIAASSDDAKPAKAKAAKTTADAKAAPPAHKPKPSTTQYSDVPL